MSDEALNDGASILRRAPVAHALVEAVRATRLSLDGVWLVGGAVRDAVLGRPPGPDVDLAVEGAGVAFANLLASATGGEVVAEHPFGTATILVPLGDPHGTVRVDVASCRSEVYLEPGALPTIRAGATIEADLARRDVAANAVAIAMSPDDKGVHPVIDPRGGLRDIELRRLRVLHDRSFNDDPTRIFRVARYAGRLGFRVDDHTRGLAIAAVADGVLGTVSADRVRAELELVLHERAWEPLTFLASWGVVERLDPRLEGAFRRPFLLRAIDHACGGDVELDHRAWTLRLAAFARPLGADCAGWMRWLGFPAEVVDSVAEHVRILDQVIDRRDELREMPNSKLYVELGEVTDDSFALAALALDDDVELLTRLDAYRTALRDTRLTVRGDDVVAAGVPAGPAVGRILGELFLRALDGQLQGEQDERRLLDVLVADQPTAGDTGE